MGLGTTCSDKDGVLHGIAYRYRSGGLWDVDFYSTAKGRKRGIQSLHRTTYYEVVEFEVNIRELLRRGRYVPLIVGERQPKDVEEAIRLMNPPLRKGKG